MMLHGTLKSAAASAVADLSVSPALSVPLGWIGEVFAPPASPHVRGRIVYGDQSAASCGCGSLTRIDGSLEFTVCTPSGSGAGSGAGAGDSACSALARQLAAKFPRGLGLACTGGEAVFATPILGTATPDNGRITIKLTAPFYALLTPEGV